MPTFAYLFDLTNSRGETRRYVFPAHSKQMAWVAAASYIACHTLNPAIQSLALVGERRIVEVAIKDGEISTIQAANFLTDPTF